MDRKLWVHKLSDDQLKEMLMLIQDVEASGYTLNKKVWQYADTWYSHLENTERLQALSTDIYKEVAFRWLKQNSYDNPT